MKKLYAWLCLVGGLLWGAKPVYDWLVLGRKINTGYIPTDRTDYIKFAFPLLCLAGIYVLVSLYKKNISSAAIILSISLVLHALFHFSEVYLYESGIPFGLLFLFFGTIFLLVGSITLMVQLKKEKSIPRVLYWLSVCLSVNTFLFCGLPFVSEILIDSVETPILVGLMMFIGFIWAAIGAALISVVRLDSPIVSGRG